MLFPIFDIISLRKNWSGKKLVFFLSWSLRGCSEPASQACRFAWILRPGMIVPVVTRLMVPSDSAQKWGRAGNLAGALQFFNFIPRPLPIIIFILVFLCSCVSICHPAPIIATPLLGYRPTAHLLFVTVCQWGVSLFYDFYIYLFRVLCKHAKSNNFCIMCEIFRCLFYMLIEFCPVFGVWGENFAYY